MMTKQIIKNKIKNLAYLHGVHVKETTGHNIDLEKEETRLYNEYVGGMITFKDIQDDINEYLHMRNTQ